MSILDKLGIYIADIDHAYKICMDTLNEAELVSEGKEMIEYTEQTLEETFVWNGNVSNQIIQALFEGLCYVIEQKYPDAEKSYYINGYDSHFYFEKPQEDE